MQKFDLHVHTCYSDGKNSPETVVQKAIEIGLEVLGFSDHGVTETAEIYGMNKVESEKYFDEISLLKEKYKDKIKILCGVEKEIYSSECTDKYDYVIGSVHYIKVGDNYIPVDHTPEKILQGAENFFGGDIYKMLESYFDSISKVAEETNCDIIGHFDLVTKFNEQTPLFDENDERYVNAWKSAVDRIIERCRIFEINTGAMSRGYRTTPYPSREMIDYIKSKGGKLILSSDSHKAEDICYKFEDAEKYSGLAFQKSIYDLL